MMIQYGLVMCYDWVVLRLLTRSLSALLLFLWAVTVSFTQLLKLRFSSTSCFYLSVLVRQERAYTAVRDVRSRALCVYEGKMSVAAILGTEIFLQ